jgi:hypothetical protein
LAAPQQAALDLLCTGASVVDTARAAGVCRTTIYQWLRKDPVFSAAYNQWQDEMDESCRAHLTTLQAKATKALEKALEKGDARAALQLLKGTGIISRPRRRITDPAELKRKNDLDAQKRQNKLEKAERRVVLDREVDRMMDKSLEEVVTEQGPQPVGKRVVTRTVRVR